MYTEHYISYERVNREKVRIENMRNKEFSLFEHLATEVEEVNVRGFKYMDKCRFALRCIDRRGWERSFHQRDFHEAFLKASTRVFWKSFGSGAFQRDYQRVLELNGWDELSQEILVSTPRRFGKTISVSMFAAALMFSAPAIQISIYSTCKRISQKLLENVLMFLDLVHKESGTERMKEVRRNTEQVGFLDTLVLSISYEETFLR